jgi:hypothetical protein
MLVKDLGGESQCPCSLLSIPIADIELSVLHQDSGHDLPHTSQSIQDLVITRLIPFTDPEAKFWTYTRRVEEMISREWSFQGEDSIYHHGVAIANIFPS